MFGMNEYIGSEKPVAILQHETFPKQYSFCVLFF